MSRSSRDFKDTQVFDWESEPKDERPSEFVSSTGYSSLSGYYNIPEPVKRRRGGSGLNVVVIAGLVVVGLGAAALFGFLHLIRA